MSSTRKRLPRFKTEAEERAFWESRDSADYVDWSRAERTRLPNLKPSSTSILLRLLNALLERVKVAAGKRGVRKPRSVKFKVVLPPVSRAKGGLNPGIDLSKISVLDELEDR